MSGTQQPSEAPPSYQDATGASSSSSRPNATTGGASSSHLDVPAIPAAARRSMEDEMRPLPKGWVRTFDPESQHQFFVDTRKDPPLSIWVHPYDDPEYLGTLSSDERERIEQESMDRGKKPSKADIMSSHTDDEDDATSPASSHYPEQLPPRTVDGKGKGKASSGGFGRKVKDKLTGTTHEQREAERKRRAAEDRRLYEEHVRVRNAMAKAIQTGKPQLAGKDKNGNDVYIEPPQGMRPGASDAQAVRMADQSMTPGPAGFGYNAPGSGYQAGYPGMYAPPNARYLRPYGPYARPPGRGFGGGYGMPLALGGGLLGGLLIGDAIGGGF